MNERLSHSFGFKRNENIQLYYFSIWELDLSILQNSLIFHLYTDDLFDELSSLPQDMIHIADTKVARRYGDFFIRQIHKFEEVRVGKFTAAFLITQITLMKELTRFTFPQLNRTLKKMPLSVTSTSGTATGRWVSNPGLWQPIRRRGFLWNRKKKINTLKQKGCVDAYPPLGGSIVTIMEKDMKKPLQILLFLICFFVPIFFGFVSCPSSHRQGSKVIAYFFYYHRSSNISQHMTDDNKDKGIKMYKMRIHTNIYIYKKKIKHTTQTQRHLPYKEPRTTSP